MKKILILLAFFPAIAAAQVQMFFTQDVYAAPVLPNDVDSLFYWFAADVAVYDSVGSAISDYQGVGEWEDLSGRGHHLLQTTNGARPSFRLTGGPNNRPALFFDGTNDFLATASHWWESDDLTIFMVMKFQNATRNAVERVISHTNHASNYQFLIFGNTAANNYNYTFQAIRPTGAAANSYFSVLANWKSTDYRLIATTHFGNTTATLHQNGSISSTSNSSSGTGDGTIFDASSPLEIGAIGAGSTPTQFFQGFISEIIVYSRALTSDERQGIENYLNNKYKLY